MGAAPKPAKKAAVKKAASKPKSDAVSKARAPVASTAKTSAAKPSAAAKATSQEERRKGTWLSEAKTRQWLSGRDAIVAFIRANPGKVGTREIAREFGLKNADRAELKRILRELADGGTIKKHGKKVTEEAQLPATLLADVTTRDADGELIATPAEWDEAEGGEPPKIRIHIPRHARPGTMAGVGDRALLRIEA